jgi:hypothetical protein
MRQFVIPGASVAVITDYRIEWAKGFGLRDQANNLAAMLCRNAFSF